MSLPKIKNIVLDTSAVGLFSKKEAASLVVAGIQHVHSTELGKADPLAILTYSALDSKSTAIYSWEKIPDTQKLYLTQSTQRKQLIQQVFDFCKIKSTSTLGSKIYTAVEEIFTNSLYHAFKNSDGTDKYERKSPVSLQPSEKVILQFGRDNHGVFFSISDTGSGLDFKTIQKCFERCYQKQENQIETKNSGAGLGLYVVFELATHLKIESHPGKGAQISCWFSNSSAFSDDRFSINYFQGVKIK